MTSWLAERRAIQAEAAQATSPIRQCPNCSHRLVSRRRDLDEGLRSTWWGCTHCLYRDRGAPGLTATRDAIAALNRMHEPEYVELRFVYDETPFPVDEL